MSVSNLEIHVMQQALFPDIDKPQWMAYMILYQLYPNLTCLSMDGYHCHGIADYSEGKMFYWQDHYKGGIINWTDKSLIVSSEKDFCDMGTDEIINIWTKLNGETEDSKSAWLRNLKENTK